MNHVKEILAGLGVFIIVGGFIVLVFGGGFYTAHQNQHKVERMTQFCIDHGYRGWSDGDGNRNDSISNCVSK